MDSHQYAFRAQKSLDLVEGKMSFNEPSTYNSLEGFVPPEGTTARTWQYSTDGKMWAVALPNSVQVFDLSTVPPRLAVELDVKNVIELAFSPRAKYLSTWERPIKIDENTPHKNLQVFDVSTSPDTISSGLPGPGTLVASFVQKSQDNWDLQYTPTESHALRLVGPDVHVYKPDEWDQGIVEKLHLEGVTAFSLSPGANPSIAVFVPEKKGAPASVKIYNFRTLQASPTCQKNFFKADKIQFKWNSTGTQLLFMTHTEVDKTNKSYYGETGLYLMSAAGQFDCRVTLDKEGPIHDFAWNPNGKEFGVVYGYMPAKTVLFDQRVRTVHDFNSSPHNFISFNPKGTLLILAGFGNLAGKIDVFDRRTLNKITTIDAPNTSVCDWSPDGQFLLTATLSPRLRVDNGIKIWSCHSATGDVERLIHAQSVDELYQAGWRPNDKATVANQSLGIPKPSKEAATLRGTSTPLKKPAGAYRPPGARGSATPSIFKREDEGGLSALANGNSNGTATPPRGYSRSPAPGMRGGAEQNGQGVGRGQRGRHVPGAGPPAHITGSPSEGRGKQHNNAKKGGKRSAPNTAPPTPKDEATPVPPPPPPPPESAPEQSLPAETEDNNAALDATAKKIRNLTKKLKAIEELKAKAARGERLEVTQVRKMEGEEEIRKELAKLGAAPS